MTTSDQEGGRTNKVARLIDEYVLKEVGAELEQSWTADDSDERRSLRELADDFNRQLLRSALQEAGEQTLDGEIANIYRLLTADDVGAAERTRVKRRLERSGIDVEALRSDFVSYQAIRTYLKEDRGAEYSRETTDPVETASESLQRLRTRTIQVTESKVTQLRNNGHLSLGEPRVTVDVRVLCEDCGSQFETGELLNRGSCDCADSGT